MVPATNSSSSQLAASATWPAARIAARKAEDAAKELGLGAPMTKGSVVASDAFFPFADGLLVAIEAGATAVQELAFTIRDGIEYVDDVIRRKKMNVDDFASRLSFFFNSHIDFFEEICKMRAARRMWAKIMRDRFHAKDPRSLWLRFHTQTAGCSLTAQQPYNNVIRTTV